MQPRNSKPEISTKSCESKADAHPKHAIFPGNYFFAEGLRILPLHGRAKKLSSKSSFIKRYSSVVRRKGREEKNFRGPLPLACHTTRRCWEMEPRPPAALPVVCTRSGPEVRQRPAAGMVAHPSLNCSSLAGTFHFSTTKDASVLGG